MYQLSPEDPFPYHKNWTCIHDMINDWSIVQYHKQQITCPFVILCRNLAPITFWIWKHCESPCKELLLSLSILGAVIKFLLWDAPAVYYVQRRMHFWKKKKKYNQLVLCTWHMTIKTSIDFEIYWAYASHRKQVIRWSKCTQGWCELTLYSQKAHLNISPWGWKWDHSSLLPLLGELIGWSHE